jgi:hypothetical protein
MMSSGQLQSKHQKDYQTSNLHVSKQQELKRKYMMIENLLMMSFKENLIANGLDILDSSYLSKMEMISKEASTLISG